MYAQLQVADTLKACFFNFESPMLLLSTKPDDHSIEGILIKIVEIVDMTEVNAELRT